MTSAVAAEFVTWRRIAFLLLLLQGVVGDQRGGARIFDEGEGCLMIVISRRGVVGDQGGGARMFDEGEACVMILISLQGVVGDRCGGCRICCLGEGGVHCEFVPGLLVSQRLVQDLLFGDGWCAL